MADGGHDDGNGEESFGLGAMMAKAPLPLFALKPVFARLMTKLVERHPDLFDRLGEYAGKTYLIDPVDLPFVLLLRPAPEKPELIPLGRGEDIDFDASISGPIDKFVELVNGEVDGDALFFSRALVIEGDTEAVLALRNAVDDMEINLAEEIENMLGPLAPAISFMRKRAREAGDLAADLKMVVAESLHPSIDRARGAGKSGKTGKKGGGA